MEEKQLEQIVDKKILEAKLENSEKRFQTISMLAGAALTLFGIFVPILITLNSSNKVDESIHNMNNEFDKLYNNLDSKLKEASELQREESEQNSNKINASINNFEKRFNSLASDNLKRPLIECLYQGRSIEGINLPLDNKTRTATFEIKNLGQKSARSIGIKLYTIQDYDLQFYNEPYIWLKNEMSDEPGFKISYDLEQRLTTLDPKESRFFNFYIDNLDKIKEINTMMIKIFYDQPEPKIFSFKLVINND